MMFEGPFAQESCDSFSAALASDQGTPGGGSAAAYAGALGAALASMAAVFTVGKKKYEQYWDDLELIIGRSDSIRRRLIELLDEDARALAPLTAAYSLPKEDPSRADVLELATMNACSAPREVMSLACETIELLERLREECSALLISDVGCGAALCRACLESASLNVFVNTSALAKREQAALLDEECRALLEEYVPRAQSIVDAVQERFRV